MKKKITPIIARGYLLLTLFLLLGMLANSQAVNRSLKFNGTTQYGRVTSNAALQLRSFTIEMWVRPEGSSTA